jgi:hypothetical protein
MGAAGEMSASNGDNSSYTGLLAPHGSPPPKKANNAAQPPNDGMEALDSAVKDVSLDHAAPATLAETVTPSCAVLSPEQTETSATRSARPRKLCEGT